MTQATGAKRIKMPASVFEAPTSRAAPKPTDSSSRKCWPDQKYIVKLPTPEEMEALRLRRAAAGVKIGSVPDLPAQPTKAAAPAVKVSKQDADSMKQASETKKDGAVLKVPTAEAIEALQRRRAAAKAAAAASKVVSSAVRADGLVDHIALAREATARSKAAAHLNAPCPLKPAAGTAGPDPDHLSSFLRNKPAADPAAIARREQEAAKAAKEAELLKQRRAEAARASQTDGKTVRVPTAEEIEALKRRREVAQNTTVAAACVVAPSKDVPLSAEAEALKRRRAEAVRSSTGSGSTVKVPDAAEIEALKQRRAAAAAQPTAAPKPAARTPPVTNLSVHQKLQKKQAAKPKAVGTVGKRAMEGDLRSILNSKRPKNQ